MFDAYWCLSLWFLLASLGQLRVPSDSNNSLRWTQEQCFSEFEQVQNRLPVALTPEGHLNEYKTFSSLFISLDVFVLQCKLLQKRTQWASFYPCLSFSCCITSAFFNPKAMFLNTFFNSVILVSFSATHMLAVFYFLSIFIFLYIIFSFW